jgi:hypothetical protein
VDDGRIGDSKVVVGLVDEEWVDGRRLRGVGPEESGFGDDEGTPILCPTIGRVLCIKLRLSTPEIDD